MAHGGKLRLGGLAGREEVDRLLALVVPRRPTIAESLLLS